MPTTVTSLEDIRRLAIQERKRRKLTQTETAGLINHTQKWLSEFETGKVDPPASMVLRLIRLLGITLVAEVSVEARGTSDLDAGDGL